MSEEAEQSSRARRGLRLAGLVVAVALTAGAMGWAAATVLLPRAGAAGDASYTLVEALEGEVASSIGLTAVVGWTTQPLAANLAPGTVTSVDVVAGDEVGQGQVLYRVDLRPVSIALGETPAFRDLVRGARGPDVAQLQAMLAALGYDPGAADGVFGRATARAVAAWQTASGIPSDGVVRIGDIVFVPELPVRIRLDEAVVRGARLAGGEPAVVALGAPDFRVAVTPSQAAVAQPGTSITVVAPSGARWPAAVAEQSLDENRQTWLVLTGQDGAAVCGEACAEIAPGGLAQLPAELVNVPLTRGVVVPTAAVRSDATGAVLVAADGTLIPVTIVASARGRSVVEGVEPGMRVRAPATS